MASSKLFSLSTREARNSYPEIVYSTATAVCECLKLLPKPINLTHMVGKPETRLTGTPGEMEWSGAKITDYGKLLGRQKRLQILSLKVHDRSLAATQVPDPCPSLWLLLYIFQPETKQ